MPVWVDLLHFSGPNKRAIVDDWIVETGHVRPLQRNERWLRDAACGETQTLMYFDHKRLTASWKGQLHRSLSLDRTVATHSCQHIQVSTQRSSAHCECIERRTCKAGTEAGDHLLRYELERVLCLGSLWTFQTCQCVACQGAGQEI